MKNKYNNINAKHKSNKSKTMNKKARKQRNNVLKKYMSVIYQALEVNEQSTQKEGQQL